MSDAVIKVENLGKKYLLQHQQLAGQITLKDYLVDAAKAVGQQIRRFGQRGYELKNSREEFWALKDISFEVKQGDRLGIIGRNGAGKSTLLKILSQITEPTTGEIQLQGRVASLLEVGTGFHPDLTGRENIFLNGSILGMTNAEIKKKFDEIVAFAEIDKFLDTPVKRYSSGMYVRLAFAVAAHLEPEILIIDEVLAVGDMQFQKKCLGKMQSVSQDEGRTVLFVSHSMDTIQRLCPQCLFLEKGQIANYGKTSDIIPYYLSSNFATVKANQWFDVSSLPRLGTGDVRFKAIKFTSNNEQVACQAYSDGKLDVEFIIEADYATSVGSLAVVISTQNGVQLVNVDIVETGEVAFLEKGFNLVKINIEKLHLRPGIYIVGLWADKFGTSPPDDAFDYIDMAFEIEVAQLSEREFGMEDTYSFVTCQFRLLNVQHLSKIDFMESSNKILS
ncbi:ABC transporter ATP-binding protein [Trichothermofontia sp.]